ncbi:hypothetical protein [Bacillus sp. S/N-304-OC-R1]|uniref:hypothetical protein n=1 Tax=Bacillus sp. S/N-304-OC-R1 TaxID=2758034 RepID=UPI0021AE5955|nr:hypothetical protein [Bacillus sp. S/N-304-OC-R1]
MLKVLSSSALALTLVGSTIFSAGAGADLTAKEKSTYNLNLAHYVGASPELAEQAKRLGVDLSKVDPAEKGAKHGTKFQQAGNNHFSYRKAEGDIPVLVILAKYKDGDEPIGDMLDKYLPTIMKI